MNTYRNKDEIGLDFLSQVDIVVLATPRAKYSEAEVSL